MEYRHDDLTDTDDDVYDDTDDVYAFVRNAPISALTAPSHHQPSSNTGELCKSNLHLTTPA